jgi:hypothetical protein
MVDTPTPAAMISDLIRRRGQQAVEGAMLALSQIQGVVIGIAMVKISMNVLIHAPHVL